MHLDTLISAARRADPATGGEDIADLLWLTAQGLFVPGMKAPVVQGADRHPPPGEGAKKKDKDKEQGKDTTADPLLPKDKSGEGKSQEPTDDKPSQSSHMNVNPLPQESPGGGGAGRHLSLRVPAARALPNALEISRALRPLMRRVPSRTQWQLDEEATVRAVAEERLWVPLSSPARVRWLEVALVVDCYGSMFVWDRTLRELREMLGHHGAFRDVRSWTLDTSAADATTLHAGGRRGSRSKAGELIDATRRRLIIIASDCIGPAWSGTGVADLVQRIGRTNPVLLWQMLPQSLWQQTALRHAQMAWARASQPALPNQRMDRDLWRPLPEDETESGPVLPIITSEVATVKGCVRLLTGTPQLWHPAAILRPALPAATHAAEEHLNGSHSEIQAALAPLTAETQVAGLKNRISTPAYELFCLLGAAPLRLPIARLIQHTLVRGSQQVHLAEVFLSGLIVRVTPEDAAVEADLVDYDFRPGIRDHLLDITRFPAVVKVQSVVSEYLMRHMGQSLDFQAILTDPDSIFQAESGISPAIHSFARITTDILRRLGGKYAEAADRLEKMTAMPVSAAITAMTAITAITAMSVAQAPSPVAEMKLLWVQEPKENNSLHLARLEKVLRGKVTQVSAIDAALALLRTQHFAAVISSMGIHETGLKLLRNLADRRSEIPVAIYAAHGDLYRDKALEAGALIYTDQFDEVLRSLGEVLRPQDTDFLNGWQMSRLRNELRKIGLKDAAVHSLLTAPETADWMQVWQNVEDEEALMERAVTLIAAAAQTGYHQIFDFRNEELVLLASRIAKGLGGYRYASMNGIIGRCASGGRTVSQPDVSQDPDYIAAVSSTRSELALPIRSKREDKVLGVINIESPKVDRFGAREIRWLETLAASLAVAWSGLPGPPADPDGPFEGIEARSLTLTGPSKAGKTSYIMVLEDWWKQHLYKFNLTVRPVMSQRRREDFLYLKNLIFNQRRTVDITPKGSLISFTWYIQNQNHTENNDGCLMTFRDASGEDLRNVRSLAANRHYHHSAGIIFLLDAARMLGTSPEDLDSQDHYDVADAMIQDMERRYRGARRPVMRRIPIAVCVNKIDLLRERSEDWARLLKDYSPRHLGYFDWATCEERSLRIRELLYRDAVIGALVTRLEHVFDHIMFFAVATIGSSEKQDLVVNPIGVEDPFLYLLHHQDYLEANSAV